MRNMYNGHVDKAKSGRMEGRWQGWVRRAEWRGENGDNGT